MRTRLIIFILSWASNLLAQDSSIYFEKLYDYHKGADGAWSMVSNDDGTYILIGSSLSPKTFDITLLFLKFDQFGNLIIKKGFSKPGYQYYTGFSGSLIKTHDGGFAFAGSIKHTNTNISDALFVKFNANGDTEFIKTFGDTAFDYFARCIETPDRGFALVGGTYSFGAINGATYLVRTDSSGALLWHKEYDLNVNNACFSINMLKSKGFILGGGKYDPFPYYPPWFIITDSIGNEISETNYNQQSYRCGGFEFSPSLENGFIGYGCLDTTIEAGSYKYPRYVAKIDSNLKIVWRVCFTDPIENGIIHARQFSDSSIVIIGFQGDEVTGAANGLVAKISNSGKLIWKKEYYYNQLWKGDPLFNYFYDVQQAPDKGYVMCGFTQDSSKIPNQDIWLVKLDSNGCLQPGCDTVATGIIEVADAKSELKIFPDPAQDYTTVLYNLPSFIKNAQLEVFDLEGREIYTVPLDPHQHQITLSTKTWSEAIYVCSLVVNQQRVMSKKLMVEK